MKIASWNVNSLNVRLPHLLDWLTQAQPEMCGGFPCTSARTEPELLRCQQGFSGGFECQLD